LRLIDIVALMDILARQQVDNVMVEGGARVITSFIRLKLVDLFVITVAPQTGWRASSDRRPQV